MKKTSLFIGLNFLLTIAFAQDWEGIIVPPSPGSGMVWELQESVSDDFNYEAEPQPWVATLGGKWTNYYHGNWSGPKPTIWKREHVFVEDGNFKVIASRPEGDSVIVNGQKLAVTNLGCATSVEQVQYPIYVETNVKIMKSVLASDVWMLSSDDTQEIDICEAYGGDRWNHPWFTNMRLHLSHHVFIRQPFTDWQPSDEGSFYTDGSTVWSDDYHRIGVFWRDPWHLEYYVDGELVRIRSGKDQIDPVFHTNTVNPGDVTNDTRTGLSKPMDIIINTEDQTWRAVQGLTPTDEELANEDANTFQVDWIRVYKPVEGEVGPVTAVTITPSEVTTFVDDVFTLRAEVIPNNALDLSVTWESDNPAVASVNQEGIVETQAEGLAQIIVTTNENNKKDTCLVTVNGIPPSLELVNEFTYLTFNYQVGGEMLVKADFHAGTGNTVAGEGVKFWLREVTPDWNVVNDYVAFDTVAIGLESGTATGLISLEGVPATSELPTENWYFLYVTFVNSAGDFFDVGIHPINVVSPTSVQEPIVKRLKAFPNPTSGMLNIQHDNQLKDCSIQLLTPSGQLLKAFDFNVTPSTIQLDVSLLPKDYYVAKVVAEEVYIVPFMKQ